MKLHQSLTLDNRQQVAEAVVRVVADSSSQLAFATCAEKQHFALVADSAGTANEIF